MNLTLLTAALLSTTSPDAILADPLLDGGQAATPTGQSTPEETVDEEQATPQTVPPAPETEPQVTEGEPAGAEEGIEGNAIIVTGTAEAPPGDPLANINAATFAITQGVDKAFVEPVAKVYRDDVPSPLRKGLRNFFRNLLEPVVFLNYLLQLKPGKAFETLGRFAVNTTLGAAGLFDVAKREPFNLPYRRNGFGNTLGYYGVGPGPFLVLPLVGATSLRDFLGGLADVSVLPTAVGKPFNSLKYAIPAYTVNSLEFRIDFDERLKAINASDDPYTSLREIYLCQREADIAALKNRPAPRDCRPEALLATDSDNPAESIEPQPLPLPQPDIDTASQADTLTAPAIDAAPAAEPAPVEQGEEAIAPAEEDAPTTILHF